MLVRDEDRERLEEYVTDRLEYASALMPSLDVRTGRHVPMIPPDGIAVHVDDDIVDDVGQGADPVITAFVRPAAIPVVGGRTTPGGTPGGSRASHTRSTDGPDEEAIEGGRHT